MSSGIVAVGFPALSATGSDGRSADHRTYIGAIIVYEPNPAMAGLSWELPPTRDAFGRFIGRLNPSGKKSCFEITITRKWQLAISAIR